MKNKEWKVVASAVYYTIIDEDDKLICFMSLDEKDKAIAEYICMLHNFEIIKNIEVSFEEVKARNYENN